MLVYSSEQEHLFDTKCVNLEPFIGETDEKLTSIKGHQRSNLRWLPIKK